MKTHIILLSLLITYTVNAQKYLTKNGTTSFKASVEAFEPVEAINKSTTAVLNTNNGQIAALIFIKAFHFEIALMEEHFNENYMDSDEFPKATFNGEIKDFDFSKLSSQPQSFELSGHLTIKNIQKPILTTIELSKEENTIIMTCEFMVKPQDFDIEIPKLIREKIAKTIQIETQYAFKPKN